MKALPSREKIQALQAYVTEHRDRFAQAVPDALRRYLTPDRIARVVLLAATKQPQLLSCSPASIVNAAVQAASYGLEPGGALGEAALVPYGDQATFQFTYRGLITMAVRHGCVEYVEAEEVRERDGFVYRKGLVPTLEHEPCLDAEPGAIRCAYAIATMKTGAKKFEVVSRADLDRARAMSRSPSWRDWEGQMARKVAIKRLLKTIPLTPEVRDALDADGEIEHGELPPITEPAPTPKIEVVKQRLRAKQAQAAPAEPDFFADGEAPPPALPEGEAS